jgi:putative hydrolase of the HAD superfamily
MSSPSRKGLRAVLLDAFGTLVALEPPAPRLRSELRRRIGLEVSAEAAEAAFRAEIAFYLEHHLEGANEPSLDALRDRCAAVLADALALEPRDRPAVRAAMLDSLRFSAQPDAEEALGALRARGVRLVVVSNWDCSLRSVLAEAGLAPLLDGVVASATVGAAKPAPAVFEAALDLVESRPGDAVHVGDSPAQDVEGARAAGVPAILLDRSGEGAPVSAPTIRSLGELPSLLLTHR